MSDSSLAERIIHDLTAIFNRNPNMYSHCEPLEFDVIPVDCKLQNKCPVLVVDHRLALESWCVQHVFTFIYAKIIDSRLNRLKLANDKLKEWTRVILLINPDLTLAWNIRKELVESNCISIAEELKLSEVILTRKAKSPDNFFHRQFLLKKLLKENIIEENIVSNELRVSLDAASRYQRNYYAWAHRIWVLQNFGTSLNIINFDLNVTKHWVESHISDYSAFHYRQFLYSLLLDIISAQNNDNLSEFVNIMQAELDFLNGLFAIYPDHESLFMHRRYILQQMCNLFPEQVNKVKENEVNFIDTSVSQSYSNSVSNQWQFELIRKHTIWIKRVLKWDLDSE
ncbi:hypothetical protein B4U79_08632 [Dinothrombium tinctorium]|uniref:Protein prenyltransferase alpha subunit repeat-containing protein 1-like protein n=1 Tax=Dinothrombium tinctorium TaxID=1965070 RepID=A0A3S3Q2A8_9ACAR|nr:hypothetical protein B4U79_08632 [Dinothrombium tinctorium]